INNQGVVLGVSDTATGANQPFLWTARRGMTNLNTLVGLRFSVFFGLNDRGTVAGGCTQADGQMTACLWDGRGSVSHLGLLPGDGQGSATAVNNHNTAIGWSDAETGKRTEAHAFIWSATDGMRTLGTLGGTYTSATAINDYDLVV